MAKGYWIGRVDVHDGEGYKNYVAANAGPLAEYGGRFLVRAGDFQGMEGTHRQRNVVIEFDSYQQALDCYNSPAYQKAIGIRTPVSEGDLLVIEGYDGPQPGDG